jgi:hypothetical protein
LTGRRASAAVKARGAGGGEQGVRAAGRIDRDLQRIAAHEPARRVHEHVVANVCTFGVQALQDAQRALVGVARHRALRLQGVGQV